MSSASGGKCVGRFSYILDIKYVAGYYIYYVVALAGKGASNWVWDVLSVGYDKVSVYVFADIGAISVTSLA